MTEDHRARLEPIARVIAQQLARKPEHFITHPAELKLFDGLSDEELRGFAHDHGWRIVRRIGGRQIEFYNDAGMRWQAMRAGILSAGSDQPFSGVRRP